MTRDRAALDEQIARLLADAVLRELRAEDAVHNASAPARPGETRSDDAGLTRHDDSTPIIDRTR